MPLTPLTPDEIEDQQFTVGLRGFDQQEVVAFLKRVAADYRRALNEGGPRDADSRPSERSRPLGRLVPGLVANSDDFQEVGDQIAEVLRSATAAASTIRQEARLSAEKRLASAIEEAEAFESAAMVRRSELEAELVVLRQRAEAEAERVMADARRHTQELLDQVDERQQRLTAAENDVRSRFQKALAAVEAVLHEVSADDPLLAR